MSSIGIADKTTLDAIKARVDSYLDAAISSRAAAMSYKVASFSTASASLQTALSVSGQCELQHLNIYVPPQTTVTKLKIEVDGVTICNISTPPNIYNTFVTLTLNDMITTIEPFCLTHFDRENNQLAGGNIKAKNNLVVSLAGDGTRSQTIFIGYNS